MWHKICIKFYVQKILLIGRDLNFAWALKELIAKNQVDLELDHVFTISEAKIRLENFKYSAILIDNLKPFEIELFLKNKPNKIPLLLIGEEYPPFLTLKKDIPLQNMLSYLNKNLNL